QHFARRGGKSSSAVTKTGCGRPATRFVWPRPAASAGHGEGEFAVITDLSSQFFQAAIDVFHAHGPAVQSAASFSPTDFSIRFFLQLAIIIATCRVVGWLGQKLLAQPQVVGEMIAGVILGPSLLGLLFPDFAGAVFPKETKSVLYAGAQFGVGLYMFLVGCTLHLDHFRTKAKSAVGVSMAGI